MPRPKPRSLFVCLLSSIPDKVTSHNLTSPSFSIARAVLIILIISLYSSIALVHAQSATATLNGIVTDPAGAVVPGVNISVINIAQGFTRTAITNDEGMFTISLLSPGTYIVKAERQGFHPTEVGGVVLNVNDQKLIKLPLKVGEITQTVQIVDGTNLINQSPAVATVIDRQFIDKLPLNGRSFQQLINLAPGTVTTVTNSNEFGQFSVNGQRADANYTMIDGVSGNVSPTYATGTAFSQNNSGSVLGSSALGTTSNLASIDALQEFKVMTSSFAPEFGRTPGGQISIVTRSGGNDFHGTLFEYFRNEALDANDWFANSHGFKRSPLRQSIFGGTFSGPLLLPRFGEGGKQPGYNGHGRTFFFFSYEGQRLRLPKFAATDVPSLQSRQGATQPAIKELLNAFPLPTGPANANGFAESAATFSDPSSLDATSIRIDHLVNSKLLLFGRYNYSPSEGQSRGASGVTTLNSVNIIGNQTQTLTIGLTSPFNAAVNNELRFNWSKVRGSQSFTLDNFGGAVAPPISFFITPEFATPFSVGFASLSGGRQASLRVGSLADNLQRQLNITDSLSIAQGSHQWKFGIDYRRLLPLVGPSDYSQQVNFAGVNGALSGRASNAFILVLGSGLEPVYTNFSAFAQDTWKIDKRFVFTYGLRWDVNPAPYEKNGRDAAVVSGLENPSTMTLAPYGTPLYKTRYNNFAPRLGVSYQLSESTGRETILRAGFGIFYDLGNQTAGSAFGNSFPYTGQKPIAAPLFPLTLDQLTPPVPSHNLPATNTVYAFDPNLKLPRTYQWNLALEQSLGSQQTLTVTYVGNTGRDLLRQQTLGGTALNNPNFPSSVVVTTNSATSDYHALQIQFQRRLTRGLQVLAFHSWGHSIDIASRDSATLESFPIAGVKPEDDRGPSDFDIRHTFRTAITYDLPSPTGKGISKTLFGHWSIDGIYNWQSAPPVDVLYFALNTFGALTIAARPDYKQGVPLYITDPSAAGGKRFNAAAFSIPNTVRQGSLGRNTLRGFSLSQLDFVVRREFRISDRVKLHFRTEAFNLFNHPNFANPTSLLGFKIGSAFLPLSFGRSENMWGRGLAQSTTAGLNPLYQTGGPRSMQFVLRLEY